MIEYCADGDCRSIGTGYQGCEQVYYHVEFCNSVRLLLFDVDEMLEIVGRRSWMGGIFGLQPFDHVLGGNSSDVFEIRRSKMDDRVFV